MNSLPFPCLKLLKNPPSQASPFLLTIRPSPQALLLTNSPSQISPFPKVSFPQPFILSFTKVPSQIFPFFQVYFPLPCITPLDISPSYTFPFLQLYLPTPCFLLSTTYPTQIPSSSSIFFRVYSMVLVTRFQPKNSRGRFYSYQRMTLNARSATLSSGMAGNLPSFDSSLRSLMARDLSSFFLNSSRLSIAWQMFFFQVSSSSMIFNGASTPQAATYSSLNGSISKSLFQMSSLYRFLVFILISSMALLTFPLRSSDTFSMSLSSQTRFSYLSSRIFISQSSRSVGQFYILNRSFFFSYLSEIRLNLQVSCRNSVRQIEQSSGDYLQSLFRHRIFTYSFLCFQFMQVIRDFKDSCGFIYSFKRYQWRVGFLMLLQNKQIRLQNSLFCLNNLNGFNKLVQHMNCLFNFHNSYPISCWWPISATALLHQLRPLYQHFPLLIFLLLWRIHGHLLWHLRHDLTLHNLIKQFIEIEPILLDQRPALRIQNFLRKAHLDFLNLQIDVINR